ncbi:hypothetical protein DAPPUDRAFT_345681 [Daphnia pulex]|uniref:Uncharacterized protein n=1 Tax=Daphnia pulex TaxID=6669 RepID=E9I7I8_DAPPU|nr:hypothetical protein DAPPUDRAFT_345681 [Daphnia pulex]|eukprot:EFX60042.1 hypothetical protein DAPPUDRAFT_345681 [Daphnia pulex]
MASPAQKIRATFTLEALDQIFLTIFEQLGKEALAGAVACTSSTMSLSSNYLERDAFETLRQFYDMYFNHGEIASKKDEVNAAVDDMVSYLQTQLSEGKEINTELEIDQNEAMRKQRLSLAGVQKQLEGLITLDNGIRDQLIPALASMQFEDAVNQRLQHVFTIWNKVKGLLHQTPPPSDFTEEARSMAAILTSIEETASFYELVLQEKAPEGQSQRSVFIEF